MVRRWNGRMRGHRYIGDTHHKEVHDLDYEHAANGSCRIDAIIEAGRDQPFDSLSDAHISGYRDCEKCLSAVAEPAAVAGRR